MKKSRFVFFSSLGMGLAIAILTCAREAVAQPPTRGGAPNEAAAEVLYMEAEQLVDAQKFALACPKFKESQQLDPQLGTLLHLADCYERNNQTASAWVTFREAVEIASQKGDSRERITRERVNALTPKLSMLTIGVSKESALDGLEVERDGQPVRSAMWGTAVPVDPGKIRVTAHAPKHEPWAEEVDVHEPGRTVVNVPVLGLSAPTPTTASPSAAQRSGDSGAPPAERPSAMRTAGWIVGGAGVVGLVTGGAFAIVASSKGSDADAICSSGRSCSHDEVVRYDTAYGDAESAASTARVALGVGAVLLAVGVVLFVLAPSSSTSTQTVGAKTAMRRAPSSYRTGWMLAW